MFRDSEPGLVPENQMTSWRLRHVLIKLRMLRDYTRGFRIPGNIFYFSLKWHHEIWSRDLHEYWCCSGFDAYGQVGCGCQGATVLDYCKAMLEID